jgi:hypothetical protein
MNNKRIHELLEWIKDRAVKRSISINENQTIDVEPDPIYEIIAHLLEEDIKNNRKRPFCKEHGEDYKVIFKKDWFMVSPKGEYFHNEGWFYCPICFVKEAENLESILEDNPWLDEYIKKSQQEKE